MVGLLSHWEDLCFAKPGEGCASATEILILASPRKVFIRSLSLYHWTVGLQDEHRSSWGVGGKHHSKYFISWMLPPPGTNRTLILCCHCGFWLHGLQCTEISPRGRVVSLCAWKVLKAFEAVDYQLNMSLSAWRPAQPISFQAPTQPIFCLFYLLTETNPTISWRHPFKLADLCIFFTYMCVYISMY